MTHLHQESSEIRKAITALAGPDGFIELPEFVQTALYHPQFGYYCKPQQRVGRSRNSDFFTASSLRKAFQEIAVEAASKLLEDAGFETGRTDWVEIGAEPNAALLDDFDSPFRSVSARRIGESLELSGDLVAFSNELFDAQPFRQLRFDGERWQEFGLRFEQSSLVWTPRSTVSDEAEAFRATLPQDPGAGYILDLPTGSLRLARALLAENWSGVFIALDYGKTWQNLSRETPQGTARSYRQHRQNPDILANPGDQDITTHVCWDHLEEALRAEGFESISLQSQESFIIRRAPRFMQKVFDPSRSPLDPLRAELKQLMHPALMGQKFQVLTAVRRACS